MKPLTVGAFRAAGERGADGLAQLPQCFMRFAKQLGRNVAKLTPQAPSFAYDSLAPKPAKFAEDCNHAVFLLECAEPWHMLRLVLDKPLVLGLCDLLLGGVGNEPPFADERPLSRIEIDLAELLAAEVGSSFPEAFPSGMMQPFVLKSSSEDEKSFEAVLSITILAAMHGYSGEMRLELPQSLLDLFKPETATAESGSMSAAKPCVDSVNVDLTAILAEVPMNLDDVGRFARGQLIRLGITATSPVAVLSGGVELFKARLGQSDRKYSLGVI
jgi:flagellar motor switch protein FliM